MHSIKAQPRRLRRNPKALLWSGSVAVGLACFFLTLAGDYWANRRQLYPLFSFQGLVYDRAMTGFARDPRKLTGPVSVVEIREETGQDPRLNNAAPFLPGEKERIRFDEHPRAFHARVVENLRRLGARVIVFDILFDRDQPRWDRHFAAAMRRHKRVILAATAFSGLENSGLAVKRIASQMPTPDLREAAAAVAMANVPEDVDRVVRRFYWWLPGIDDDTAEDIEIPSLGVAAAALYSGKDPRRAIRDEVRPKGVFLGRPTESMPEGELRTSLINYYGPSGFPSGADSVIAYEDVFDLGRDPQRLAQLRERLRDRIVFIGDASLIQKDHHAAPVSSAAAGERETRHMPGAEIQAHIAQTALMGRYRRQAPEWARAAMLLLGCMAIAMMGRLILPLPLFAATLILISVLIAASTQYFHIAYVWLEPATASAGMTLTLLLESAFMHFAERRDRLHVKRQLRRHVGPGVADRLDVQPDLAGESCEITMLFSDLQGFTSISESMSSQEICSLLNRYFGVVFPILFRHGGTLDKLMGDGLMAYFGYPVRQADHAARGLRCALEMQRALKAWQQQPENAELPTLRTRIGIHTGSATVGGIGSGEREEFTVIGDVVNVASRLEGMNKEFGTTVLISEATRQAAGDLVPLYYRGEAAVRGRREPIPVYSVEPPAPLEASPAREKSDSMSAKLAGPLAVLLVLCLAPGVHAQTVSNVRATVRVVKTGRSGSPVLTDARIGEALSAGDRVRTGGRSSAGLGFPDRSRLTLGELTEVVVTSARQRDARVLRGKVLVSYRAPGTISGGYAVAAVRGTRVLFSTDEERELTEVHCFQGRVFVASADNPVSAGSTTFLTAGTLTDGRLAETDQDWTGGLVRFVDGPALGQSRRITAFDRNAGTVRFEPELPPAASGVPSGYLLVKNPGAPVVELRDNEGTTVRKNQAPTAAYPVPNEEFARLTRKPFFTELVDGKRLLIYPGTERHWVDREDEWPIRDALRRFTHFPCDCHPFRSNPGGGYDVPGQSPHRTPLGRRLALARSAPPTQDEMFLPAMVRPVPDSDEPGGQRIQARFEPFALGGTDDDQAAGARLRVQGTAGDVFAEVGYRYAWISGDDVSDISEGFVHLKGHDGDIIAGRQHLFLGPTNNTRLGTLLGLEATDAVVYEIPSSGRAFRQQFGYVFDSQALDHGGYAGAYARGLTLLGRGNVGYSILGSQDRGSKVGWSLDASQSLIPNVLDIYGEGGRHVDGRNIYTAGLYVPWLYHRTKLDLFLEYANREDLEERTTVRLRRELGSGFLLVGYLTRRPGDNIDAGGGFVWSLKFR